MKISVRSDRIISENGIFDGYLYFEDGRITELSGEYKKAEKEYDLRGRYVSPGFIELHSHGGGGFCFTENCTAEDIIKGCDFHCQHGTTSILPTVTSETHDIMREALSAIHEARKSGCSKANIIGAHLEGPYFSPKQCGAQSPDYITPPIKENYEELYRDFGESIIRWSYAPELDADGSFGDFLRDKGIIASAAHTDAIYDEMMRAREKGCRLVTHLYSCTSTITRDHGFRRLGVIETAYLYDDIFVEIIADGKHLPSELVRMIVKIKGVDKVAAVSDSIPAAGMADGGEGIIGGTAFVIEDGVAKLPDRSAFCGSIATADVLLRFLCTECGFDVTDTVKMMSKTPASILGLKKGILKAGYDADITVFDEAFNITDVFVGGEKKL